MTRAYWTYRDLLLGICLLLPSILIASLAARLIPASKTLQAVAAQMLLYVVWFILLRSMLRMTYDRPLALSLGWWPVHRIWMMFLIGVALAFALGYLGLFLKAPQIDPPFKPLLDDKLTRALFALAGVVMGPIAEELAFRGFLMPLLAKSMPVAAAVVATAAPFALLHGQQYQWSWQHVMIVFLAGTVFGGIRAWQDSTLASAVAHGAYNFTLLAGYLTS